MNHMTKKEIAFPIAAVFSTLNVLVWLISIFVTYTTYTRIIGIPMSEVHRAVAGSILSLVPGILLGGLNQNVGIQHICLLHGVFSFFMIITRGLILRITKQPVFRKKRRKATRFLRKTG